MAVCAPLASSPEEAGLGCREVGTSCDYTNWQSLVAHTAVAA